MFANFIHDFKMQIYYLLSGNADISAKVNSVYIAPTQDAKHPFLLINIIKVIDCSKFNCNMYNIEFEVCIFTREKNQNISYSLLDKITSSLISENCQFGDYMVSAIKASVLDFDQSRDLISNKLSIKYKALIKRGE
ncbi:MAG: hypothetical protein ACRYE9_00545 [Janthinobacterium lividum]